MNKMKLKLPQLKIPTAVKEAWKTLMDFLKVVVKALVIATIITIAFGAIIYILAMFLTMSLVPPFLILLIVRSLCILLFIKVFSDVFKEMTTEK
jgi:uncharacterized RDD family membrane protein YckC